MNSDNPNDISPEDTVISPQSKPSIISWILIIVLVSLGFVSGLYGFSKPSLKKVTANITPTPTSKVEKTPVPTKAFSQINRIEKDGKKTPVFVNALRDDGQIGSYIYQWKDYLLIFDFSAKKIAAHNTVTGVSSEIGTITYKEGDFPSLMWPHVIDDSVYFSYGGYLQLYPVFYINHPPTTVKILKNEFENASVTTIEDSYYLIGGTGDSCFGRGAFSRFDPSTKQSWPTFYSYSGCGEGEQIVAHIAKDRVLMSNRIMDTSEPDGWFIGLYKDLYEINSTNPASKAYLLTAENMPKNVKSMEYFKNSNKVALFGSEIFLYDLSSKQLESVSKRPEEGFVDLYFKSLNGDILCAEYRTEQESEKTKHIDINIKTKTITTRTKSCDVPIPTPSPVQKEPQTLQEQIDLLKLPSNYEIIYN